MKKLFKTLLLIPIIGSASTVHDFFGNGLEFELNATVNIDIDNNGQDDFAINTESDILGIFPIYAEGCYDNGQGNGFNIYYGGETFANGSTDINDWEENIPTNFYHATNGLSPYLLSGQDFYIRIMLYNVGKEGFIHLKIDEVSQKLVILDWMYTDESTYELPLNTSSVVENDFTFSTFPNPATDIISIKSSLLSEAKIEIIDINGNICLHRKIDPSGKTTMSVSDLSPGVYFISYYAQERKITKKLLIQ
jgi:hypothetical protein